MKNNNIKVCSKCGVKPRRENHEWCLDCYREYKAKWTQEHEDHVKEYRAKWLEENADRVKAYNQAYRENNKSYYLYIILKEKEVLYVGATEHIKDRINQHINGHSHIRDLIFYGDWDYIKVLDLNRLNLKNRQQLLCLENFLIHYYEPPYNTQVNIIRGMSKKEEFQLICELHSFEVNKNFKTYITHEEFLLRKQKKLSKLGA